MAPRWPAPHGGPSPVPDPPADPVALHLFDALSPIEAVEVIQQPERGMIMMCLLPPPPVRWSPTCLHTL